MGRYDHDYGFDSFWQELAAAVRQVRDWALCKLGVR